MKNLIIFDLNDNELIKVNKHKLSILENKLSLLLDLVRKQPEKWLINWFYNGILSSKFKLENEQLINEKSLEITNSFNCYYCGINCISKLKSFETKLEIIKQNKKLLLNNFISVESLNQITGNLGKNDIFLLENYFGNYNDFTNYEQLNNELIFGKMFLQNSEVPRGITIQS